MCRHPLLAIVCLASTLFIQSVTGQSTQDFEDVTLAFPSIKVHPDIDTIVVPVNLTNEWDEVGGIQLDLSLEKWGLNLDTILTTPRSVGWRVESRIIDLTSNRRILLFDPTGNNILPGGGPIMELVVLLPEDTPLPDSIPLTVESAVVSDVMGRELLSKYIGGSLIQEADVRIVVGRTRIDHGQTGHLGIHLSSSSPIMGAHFTCQWDTRLMSIIDIAPGNQLADSAMEWESNDHGAWIGLSNRNITEKQLGVDDSLILHLKVVPGVRFSEALVRLMDARMIDTKGREWRITHVDSGSVEIYPGYLDPPEPLVALSGQDGRVPLIWRPPGEEAKGNETLLLVDDDASELGPPYFDTGGRMADALTGAGYRFDYYRVPAGSDGPSQDMFDGIQTLIWVTGYEWGHYPTLSSYDQANLASFLMNGGKVWLIGQDIISDIGAEFPDQYFGVQLVAEDVGTPEIIHGVTGSAMEGTEYKASVAESHTDYGDAITTRHPAARNVVEGFTHAGAVGQERTAFWGIEFTFIMGFMDRIDGIRRQLHAFGIQPDGRPGIGTVVLADSPERHSPRFPSPIKPDTTRSDDKEFEGDSLQRRETSERAKQSTTLPLTDYAVYRNEVNGDVHDEPELLAKLKRGNHAFEDSSVINGRTYSYSISAIYQGQYESEKSEAVLATPASWIDFGIGHTRARIEHKAQIPIRIKNDAAISGLRFKLRETPIGAVVDPTAVLGPHSPPDWVVSVERDSAAQEWTVVAFSPQLTVIPAGEGNVLLLAMDPVTDVPVKVVLEPQAVEVLDPNGSAYPSRITPGTVDIDVPPVQLRIGTGPPTSPGDTGFVSIYMDNPHPVRAFKMVLLPASGLENLEAAGTTRLPEDAHVAWSDVEGGGVRLIELSFTNTPIAAGSGPIATVSCLVDSAAPEGTAELSLDEVVLLGTAWGELPYEASLGQFPIGEVRAVFIPASEKGAPGRVVTTALQLTNSADICDFELQVSFNSQYLSFLSMEILERISFPEGIAVQSSDTGKLSLQYAGLDSLPIAPGSGPLLNLVFFLAHATPGDTAYLLEVNQVAASGCEGQVIFARGESEMMIVGVPPPQPHHFTVDVEPTGITHVLQLQSATLGGVYLDTGDELAVVDSGGWINAAGDFGPLVVGAGVVQADGSIQITAVSGFDPGGGTAVLPGARTGNPVYYLAWDHNSNTESRSGNNAQYVLGEGNWGENDGFTIVRVVRLGERTSTIPRPVPDDLIVTANDPNPFHTTTTIRFGVPIEMQVKIAVYDLIGREIVVLHDGITAPGYHGVEWDGRDDTSNPIANGMYFYQVRTPDRTITRKMLLMQ
jgi:hypothetical protein